MVFTRKSCGATNIWKLLSSTSAVVLFIMLYKVVLTFESVDEIPWCDHSNESYWAVLSCGTVYYAVQGGFNFCVCGWNSMVWPCSTVHYAVLVGSNFCVSEWNPMVWPFKWKLLSSTFLWYCLVCYTRWFYDFWVCAWNPGEWLFKWKLLSSTFLWFCLTEYAVLLSLWMKRDKSMDYYNHFGQVWRLKF